MLHLSDIPSYFPPVNPYVKLYKKDVGHVRELYPIVALKGMFDNLYQNQSLIFHCDNQAIVAVVNKRSAKNPTIMKLLNPLILNLVLNNIKFKAVYITSKDNVSADAISWFQKDAQLLKNYQLWDEGLANAGAPPPSAGANDTRPNQSIPKVL